MNDTYNSTDLIGERLIHKQRHSQGKVIAATATTVTVEFRDITMTFPFPFPAWDGSGSTFSGSGALWPR